MSSIYIHIPFCKKRCTYCDFHFSTSLKNKQELLKSMLLEIKLRKSYLKNKQIKTIYFGGGTPSLLSKNEIDLFLNSIYKNFNLSSNIEITVEANPDDLTNSKIKDIKDCGVNRLSIGIQSFKDSDLKFMRRMHNSKQGLLCIENAKKHGFKNISIDLIFGLPKQTTLLWKKNLETVFSLDIQHISAYCLTVEPNTLLAKQVNTGLIKIDDENSKKHFELLINISKSHGFNQYEISNYCKVGFESIHNTNYWNGGWYLGIGPSAHSFNGKSRSWNKKNNIKYIELVNTDQNYFDSEVLTSNEIYNEYIITRLRMESGINIKDLLFHFELEISDYFQNRIKNWIKQGMIQKVYGNYSLTSKGKLYADGICSDLFLD